MCDLENVPPVHRSLGHYNVLYKSVGVDRERGRNRAQKSKQNPKEMERKGKGTLTMRTKLISGSYVLKTPGEMCPRRLG